jgi:hypothetical protein
VIEQIPDELWRPYRGGQIAETVHCMNRTHNAFRLDRSAKAHSVFSWETGRGGSSRREPISDSDHQPERNSGVDD